MTKAGNEKAYLLDSSALMAFLEDEDGAGEVEKIIRERRCLVPFLALLEIYYITLRERGEDVALKRYALLKNLEVEVLSKVDEPTLLMAGNLKASFKISLADAIIAGFANRERAVLVHKDPEYEQLREEVEMFALPYKKGKKEG